MQAMISSLTNVRLGPFPLPVAACMLMHESSTPVAFGRQRERPKPISIRQLIIGCRKLYDASWLQIMGSEGSVSDFLFFGGIASLQQLNLF